MGSIPIRTNKFAGTYQKLALEIRLTEIHLISSYSVAVITADFESADLGSSPSRSFINVFEQQH